MTIEQAARLVVDSAYEYDGFHSIQVPKEAFEVLKMETTAIPFVERATGRTIPDLTGREHVCEWQSAVKPSAVAVIDAKKHAAILQHGRNCPYWNEQSETDCTCGLRWRIALQTEQTMHAAWRKRAEEAEQVIEGASPVEPGHSLLVRSMMGWMRKFKAKEKELDDLQFEYTIEREAVAKWRDRAQKAAAELGEVVEAASQARILLIGMKGHWPGTMSIDAKHVLDLLDRALPQMVEG